MFRRSVHQTIHLTCLILVAFFMPVSVWLVSVFSIVICVNWLTGGDLVAKLRIFFSRKDQIMIFSLFGLYLLWLLNTSDLYSAMRELRLSVPLFYFPLVIGSAPKFRADQLRLVLVSFVGGCVVAAGAGFLALAGFGPEIVDNPRDLAQFVPATRLIVFINFGIFTSFWLALDPGTGSAALRTALSVAAAAMAVFLFRLLSVTGIVILLAVATGTGLFLATRMRMRFAGLFILAAVAAAVTLTAIVAIKAWTNLHKPDDPSINEMAVVTQSGNSYKHYPEENYIENGYLVWINISEEELKQEWNRRSLKHYDGEDKAGNELRVTLIRYMTYLGLRKDSTGVAHLKRDDIKNIENGFANPLYAQPATLRAKAYELSWEIDRALKGANPSGHSLMMRLEFYKASWGIIRKHPWFGVGTGDVRQAFIREYEENNSPLGREYRMRAHNQYLGFAISFGVTGLIIALVFILCPWLSSVNRNQYLFVVFIAVVLISMFNDDTFGSFTGATFFSYFYTLFLVTDFKHENKF